MIYFETKMLQKNEILFRAENFKIVDIEVNTFSPIFINLLLL